MYNQPHTKTKPRREISNKEKTVRTYLRKKRRYESSIYRPKYDPDKTVYNLLRVIHIPEVLEVSNKESFDFISRLGERLIKYAAEGYPVFFNFSNCTCIDIACCLTIMSDIHRYRSVSQRLVGGNFPKYDTIAHKVLHDIGFYSYLNVGNTPEPKLNFKSNHKILNIRSGYNSPEEYRKNNYRALPGSAHVKSLDSYIRDLLSVAERNIFTNKVNKSLQEGLMNVADHAYMYGSYINNQKFKWWMTGTYNKEKRSFSLVFLDRGCGIPETISKRHLVEYIKYCTTNAFSKDVDANKIMYATSEDITRTLQKGRGKGLKDIIDLVQESVKGKVRIYSGKGCYVVANNGNNVSTNCLSLNTQFTGTMIVWSNLHLENGLN